MAGAPWTSALDAQLELIRFWRSAEGVQVANMANLIPAMRQGLDLDLEDPRVRDQVKAVGRKTAATFADQLDRAATYWVAAEVVRLLAAAGPSLPPVTPRIEDLPYPSGFAYFETGVPTSARIPEEYEDYADDDFLSENIEVLQWAHDGEEVVVVPYFAATTRRDGRSVTPHGTPLGAYHWRYGEPIIGNKGLDEIARLIMAFWLLSQQRIAQAQTRQVTRSARRRAERAKFELPEDGIRVVTLRRLVSEPAAAALPVDVDWSHRWIVGGHWRQHWYPSLDDHRPLWIAPYVKGPDGAPLVVKDRVYRFTR
jgi:hypothetical protein